MGVLGIGRVTESDGDTTSHQMIAKGVISSVGPEGNTVKINAEGYDGLSGGLIFDRECDKVAWWLARTRRLARL